MDMIEPHLKFSPSGLLTPQHWGLIFVEGPDAGTFLQGQLTNDVLLLPEGQARFAGYCSAKGRLLGSFVVLKISKEKYLLVCHQDLLQAMVKRLSMFVMRAKLKISDASTLYEIRGLLGETALLACPALKEAAPWQATQEGETYFVKLHNARNAGTEVQRLIWLGLKGEASSAEFLNQPYPNITEEAWQLAEVLSGVSMVQTATAEAFVPQMLNYESVDGVSFKKGCYPGQEVVARSQFRGTLKRRAFIVSCPEPMHVGQEIFSSEDTEQACGMVSSAVKLESLEGQAPQWWGIASLQLSATEHALQLGQAGGPCLTLKALPYPLLEDL